MSPELNTTGDWVRRAFVVGLTALALTVARPALTQAPPTQPDSAGKVTITLDSTRYLHVREALLEAIAEEGLAAPMISDFGDMLQRTAADLGHSDVLYAQAEILIFCSIAVAARLATEARGNIALCPMSIAIYTLPESPERVFMSYRLPPTQSPGSQMAAEILARITARARDQILP